MHSPPTPPADQSLGELVTAAAHRLRAAWRDQLAPFGLSPHQGRALLTVAGHPGLRPSDLAERLRIAPRSVTEVVDGLEALGMLERAPDPTDRRASTLHLTAGGTRTVQAIQRSRAAATDALFDALPAADQAHLRRILSGLVTEQP